MEIDQQAERHIKQLHVAQELGPVDGENFSHGLGEVDVLIIDNGSGMSPTSETDSLQTKQLPNAPKKRDRVLDV